MKRSSLKRIIGIFVAVGILVAACLLWIGYMEVKVITEGLRTIIALGRAITGY